MTTTDRRRSCRLTSVAGLVVFLALVGSACSSGSEPVAEAGTGQTIDTGTPIDEGQVPSGPAESLLVALDGVGQSYAFESTTSTPAGEQVTVTGRRIVDNLQYRVETAGVGVEMMSIGEQVWILEDGATDWLLDSEAAPPSADPLAAFGAPTAVRQLSGPDPASYIATYPAEALGLLVEGNVDISVDISAAEKVSFSYTDETSGLAMAVLIDPSAELEPIVPPA